MAYTQLGKKIVTTIVAYFTVIALFFFSLFWFASEANAVTLNQRIQAIGNPTCLNRLQCDPNACPGNAETGPECFDYLASLRLCNGTRLDYYPDCVIPGRPLLSLKRINQGVA